MRILGVCGYHDSGVCIVNDGEIESYFKEERFTRVKRDYTGYRSLFECMKNNKEPIDFSAICDGYPGREYYDRHISRIVNSGRAYYEKKHHLCHASLAFYNSGFAESLVFVVDRNGSVEKLNQNEYVNIRESETIFHASYPCEFKTLHKNYWVNWPNGGGSILNEVLAEESKNGETYTHNIDSSLSIVKVYESATTLINQNALENGKVMGLSSYGEDKKFVDLFDGKRPKDHLFVSGEFIKDNPTQYSILFKDHLNKISDVTPENYKFYADYAFQVQKQTQEILLQYVSEWVERTGINNVCITGGYGLNVVANEYLIKNLPNVNFYFEPLADDSGNCIGAAMHLYRKLSKDKTIHKCKTTFIHGYSSPLKQVGDLCEVEDIAEYLKNGKIVAVFNGLSESGPRALGNRSILFDSRNLNAKNIVNTVKKREWYRPFAGMILEEYFQEYFETHGWKKSEFMTVSFQCKKPEKIPGVIHVDNSCRVQTVTDDIPHIKQLLLKFMEKTNCPVLLNTSFNLAGDPLIETQKQAIECFENSGIDILWFPEIRRAMKK